MKLIDAPVGVFAFRDELVLKTEYMVNIDGVYIPDHIEGIRGTKNDRYRT